MRYLKHHIHRLGPFEDFAVDLEELHGPLVAVCGANGSGKSTLLETMPGAIFRTTPTRGTLVDLATARDAFVELTFEHDGQRYRIKQLVDSVGRKGDALLTNGDGSPLVESTKRSAVDRYVAEHFPPFDVLLVTTIAAQQSEGFIDADPADRKTLLLRMLGVERLEALAAEARKRASSASGDFTVAADRVKSERDRAVSVADAETRVELKMAAADVAAERVADERAKHAQMVALAAQADKLAAERTAALQRRDELQEQIRKATEAVTALDQRVANNRAILGRADEIRAAETELERTSARIAELSTTGLLQQFRGISARRADVERQRAELEDRVQRCDAALSNEAAVRAAVDELPGLQERVLAETDNFRTLTKEVNAARERSSGDRIAGLRQGLAAIRDSHSSIEAARETAGSTLSRDDEAVAAPDEVARLEADRNAVDRKRCALEDELRKTERFAAGADALAGYAEDKRKSEARLAELVAEETRLAAERKELDDRVAEMTAERTSLQAGLPKLEKTARLAKPLAAAEARLEELGPQLEAATETRDDLERAAGAVVIPEPVTGIDPSDEALRAAEKADETATLELGAAQGELEAAKKSAEKLAELEREAAVAGVELADWKKLAADLGKDGLQATVIDAALPELVAMTNSLLHSSFGPRFTVDVRSQSLDSRGKKTLETLDVIVIDSESGRESKAETFSGGERAIIAEGVSLALTTLASRELGVVRPTLIRDEAGAALDPENGQAWIAMLRQACSMMGADKLLFVSHSAELAELADSRVDL